MEAIMNKWYAWKERCGDQIVDFGAPFAPGQQVDANQNWTEAGSLVGGYSIVQGENLESVQQLFKDHPHLEYPGHSVELRECVAM